MNLASTIRDIPDFPIKGIIFKDITTLLNNPAALKAAIDQMTAAVSELGIDVVVGIESRGFIFGTTIAYNLGVGFVPVRKPGKLPAKTESHSYKLEYGTDTLEIHADAFASGSKVLIVDDLLATGGTMQATATLVEKIGGKVVAIEVLIELDFLKGRDKLGDHKLISVIHY